MMWPTLVRYRSRLLLRSPWSTSSKIALVALAIGPVIALAAAAIRIATQPLPFEASERLYAVSTIYPSGQSTSTLTFGDLATLREHRAVLNGLAAMQSNHFVPEQGMFDYSTGTYAIRLQGARVTPDFFDVIGVRAAVGRVFSAAAGDADDNVVVISDRLWRSTFASSRDAIGQSVRLGERPYVVIGVMSPDFVGTGRIHWTCGFPGATRELNHQVPRRCVAPRLCVCVRTCLWQMCAHDYPNTASANSFPSRFARCWPSRRLKCFGCSWSAPRWCWCSRRSP